MEKSLIVAIGTDDGIYLKSDDHCGQSEYFNIYRVDGKGAEFIEKRKNVKYLGEEERKDGDPKKAAVVSDVLKGVDVLACKIFGPNIKRMLKKYVCIVLRVDKVDDAVELIKRNFDKIVNESKKSEKEAIFLKP